MEQETNRYVEVGIALVLHPGAYGQEVLIACRQKGDLMGGYWEFPGGKVEIGEKASQAAIREVREELGITVEVEQALDKIEHEYAHGKVRLFPFVCRWRSGETANLEVDEHRWVGADELSQYKFLPANGPLIAWLQKNMIAMGR
ncbi:MAG: 8-oxo-dGTP diphosphatase MutT [Phycisphaeraceae bacterium]|nr:8-oxo-dGTP diphosphatase MutT [Phycisphaeraceae bacterium]